MNKFLIYNKSSEKMPEVTDSSVDLIFTSPPYNIGTQYGEFDDKTDIKVFQKLLSDALSECWRTLKTDGTLIIECADSVVSNGTYIQLSGYIQSIAIGLGFKIRERHFNFALSKDGVELPEHNWSNDYTTKEDSHSNCHQIMVFSKSPETVFNPNGKTMYFNYLSVEGHPCPTPEGIYNFVLNNYFKEKMVVMDIFMGTAVFGAEVLRRNGEFIGYELDESIFKIAGKNLQDAS